MPINKFIPEIWEDFNVEMNDEYTIIWPMRWYPKDETKENKKQKNKKKKIKKEDIIILIFIIVMILFTAYLTKLRFSL